MTEKIVIRASSLSGYADCARREAAKIFKSYVTAAGYTLNEPRQNVGAAIGQGLHGCLNYTLTSKMESGDLGSESAATDAAIEALRSEVKKDLIYDTVTPDYSSAEKQVIRKSKMFRNAVAPAINPTAVEVRLFANIGDGFELSGQTDYREEGAIGDAKTGKISRYNAPQYGAYSMLARSNGFPITILREHYMPTVDLRKPEPAPEIINYDVAKSENHATATIKYMKADLESFKRNGDRYAFRSNAMSMLCNEKFCTAFNSDFCQEHQKKK